jgi:hypothetical protein
LRADTANADHQQAGSREHQGKKYHNIVYNVGQKVWLYWPPQVKPGQLKKFCNWWHGPYEITCVIGDVNYEIRDLTGTRRKIMQIMQILPPT